MIGIMVMWKMVSDGNDKIIRCVAAFPKEHLILKIKNMMVNFSPEKQFTVPVGLPDITRRNVIIMVEGAASVKISFSKIFLSKCFFSFIPFIGFFQNIQMALEATS